MMVMMMDTPYTHTDHGYSRQQSVLYRRRTAELLFIIASYAALSILQFIALLPFYLIHYFDDFLFFLTLIVIQ